LRKEQEEKNNEEPKDTLVDVKRLTVAKNAVESNVLRLRDRKVNKKEIPCLWIQRINAGARLEGNAYSQSHGKKKLMNRIEQFLQI
jgi:ribosomal protein L20